MAIEDDVVAVDAAGGTSSSSNTDLATTIMVTNDPLQAGSTTVKAVHILELRTAVNAVRAAAGLPPTSFSSGVAPGQLVRALHVSELRTSLDAARAGLGLVARSYPDPQLGPGNSSRVRSVHVTSLRDAVR